MKKLVMFIAAATLLAACGDRDGAGTKDGGNGMDSTGHMMGADTGGMSMPHDSTMGMNGGAMSGDIGHDMRPMNTMMMGHLGESDSLYDRRFIDMMIPHHEGAVMMAKDALEKTARPELKKLAQGIIDSQLKEIETMRAWRKNWYGSADPDDVGGMMGRMSTMNKRMVDGLGSKDSNYEDRFIDMMIPHHQGAVMMGHDAAAKAKHAELKSFAAKIVADQENEIARMTAWRKQWYGH